jgi:large subunit ribosomal protein L24
MRIHKGDTVIMRSGKYKGRKGEVIRAIPKRQMLVLDGINVAKRHSKMTRNMMQAGIIDKFMPVPVSSVSLVCSSCDEPTRIGVLFDEHGQKYRVCKKCGVEL